MVAVAAKVLLVETEKVFSLSFGFQALVVMSQVLREQLIHIR